MKDSSSFRLALSAIALVFLSMPEASAQAIPQGLNLGFTSYMDGGPPAGPGVYYQQYLQYYNAPTYRNVDGDRTDFPDIQSLVSLNQFIYQSDQSVLPGGGKLGLNFIYPIVGIHAKPDHLLSTGDAGGGDIWVGPFIQWDPIMGEEGPIFVHRFELQTVFPTGRYNPNDAFNPGANIFQLNPYWAGTYWIKPRWTASFRAHYLWNSENSDPWVGLGSGVDDVQPGQAFHINFASSYDLLQKQLRLGLNGYFLQQFSPSKINGSSIRGRERVLAIGPGALYSFSQDDHLFLNLYFETLAVSRLEGFRLIFRWTHHF